MNASNSKSIPLRSHRLSYFVQPYCIRQGSNTHKGVCIMSTEDNKALTRRGYEALNERNWAAFDALCAPDIVFHNASTTIQGLEAYKQFISMYFSAFPDARLSIEDIIAEGDSVVVRQTFQGTHKGDLGIAPTGKQASATG